MPRSRLVALGVCLLLMPLPAAAQDDHHAGEAGSMVELAMDATWDWMIAFNSGDAVTLAGLYSDAAHLYIHGQPRVEGKAGIQDYWAALMWTVGPIVLLTIDEVIDNGDVLFVHGEYHLIERSLGLPMTVGHFEQTWVAVGDNWQIDREFWTEFEDEEALLADLLRRISNIRPQALSADQIVALRRVFEPPLESPSP